MDLDEIPEPLRLNYFVGEITISDSYAEHEARVLWGTLRGVGLVAGRQWPRFFGSLLQILTEAFERPKVPDDFREIVLPLLATTQKWHQYRADLVHDLLAVGWGEAGHVQSAIGKNPPRPMTELVDCGEALRSCGWRLRGVWIATPWWTGGQLDSWATPADMRSWTRVIMGELADVPGEIRGTSGPSPEPPGGWDALIGAEAAKREADDARRDAQAFWVDSDDAGD